MTWPVLLSNVVEFVALDGNALSPTLLWESNWPPNRMLTQAAEKRLKVAELELQASADQAAATVARGTADAKVIEFQNEAEASGWRKAVEAFGGSGDEYARWTMLRKLAPAFRNMMVNTHDNPIMEIFRQYEQTPRTEPKVEAVKATAAH